MELIGLNSQKLKKINRELVLKTIFNEKPISRANIANLLNLTPATITKIIQEFLKFGLVYEKETKIFGVGRSSIMIDIKPDNHYLVGVYIGNELISGAITNLNAGIINKVEYKKENWSHSNISMIVIDIVRELLEISSIEINKVLGIGITAIGPITYVSNNKQIKSDGEYPFTWETSINETVSNTFNKKVYIDNSSNAIAVAENWFGNGKYYKNFAVISFGLGLGAGLIIESMLYQGNNNIVAEIGHTTINNKGQKCWCGNRGCLNLFLNNLAILNKYNNLVKKYTNSNLAKKIVNNISDICNYEDKNDPIYNEIINHIADYLSIAVINLFNILDLEAVIIDINELEVIDISPIIDRITEIIRTRVFPNIRNKVKVLAGQFMSNSEVIGAASLVLKDLFINTNNSRE